jgi:hypothetical protein
VFASYGGDGEASRYVHLLAEHLAKSGVVVWFDDNLVPGDEWPEVLAEKIDTSDAVVVIMTPQAEQSRWVQREILRAERLAKPIVPLLLAGKPFFALADIEYGDVRGGVLPSSSFVARLQSLIETAPTEARSRTGRMAADGFRFGQIVVGNVPHSPPGLLIRVHLLDELAKLRGSSEAVVLAAVNGARGVGKTQLAAQYARRAVAHRWPVVVWLDAETEDTIVAGLAEVAAAAGRTPRPRTIDSARDALMWLATHTGPALIVYDNVVDPDLLIRWTPGMGAVQVLVTTLRASVADLGHLINVDVFTPNEAVQYLNQRAGPDDPAGAQQLAAELGFLPLALAQAAAMIGPGRGRVYPTYPAYLHALRTASSLDRSLPPVPGSNYPYSLAQAIRLSLHQVARADPTGAAIRLLQVLAVLAPTGVPTTLLTHPPTNNVARKRLPWRRAHHPPNDRALTDLDASVAVITDHALALPDVASTTITMHRLTQRVIRDDLTATNCLAKVTAQAATIIEAAIPANTTDRDTWALCAILLPHALAVIDPLSPAMWRMAQYPGAAGDFPTAVAVWVTLTKAYIQAFGPEHPETVNARSNLARWTGQAGDAVAARDQFAALLPIREQTLGPEHPDTLAARSNLAYWTGQAGNAAAARDQFAGLLPIWERVLGPEHPDTLAARNNLARWTGWAGDVVAARDQFAALLPMRERVLGPEHPDTLGARNNLAWWTGWAGDRTAARDHFAAMLPIWERVLGPEHPDTLAPRSNLATWTGWAGNAEAARDQFAAMLPVWERVLGPEHPDTLAARANLASWTGWAEDATAARDQYAALLPIRERVLGSQHPDTLRTQANLAGWTGRAGDAKRARDQFARVLPAMERVFGSQHPQTAATRTNLASWSGEAGDATGARDQLADLLPTMERVLGPEHPDTQITRHELGRWAGRAGDTAVARDHFAALLPIREQVLGPEHPDTLECRANLAYWTGGAGDAAAARDQFAVLLPTMERVLGPHHPYAIIARANLAYWSGWAADAVNARHQFTTLLPIQERVLGPQRPHLLTDRHTLASWAELAGGVAAIRDQFAALLLVMERVLGPKHPDTLTAQAYLISLI